jgi:cell pole-organizing protein PopZ
MPESNEQQEASTEDILRSIRDIIADDDEDDVLDLTQMLGEDGEVIDISADDQNKEKKPEGDDLLKEIDAMMEEKDEQEEEDVLIGAEMIEEALKEGEKSAKEEEKAMAKENNDKNKAEEKKATPVKETEPEKKEQTKEEKPVAKEEVAAKEEPAPKEEKKEPVEQSKPEDKPVKEDENLVSQESVQASAAALQNLVNAIPQKEISPSPEFRSGSSIEELVMESLNPMIKEWLDINLPVIVERIVEREIKKIVPNE